VNEVDVDHAELPRVIYRAITLHTSVVQRCASSGSIEWDSGENGRLIANTDMHTGNLSFQPLGPPATLTPAPAYDMLPMLYAPLAGGEAPARSFEAPLPLPPQRTVWTAACTAAIAFWWRAATDTRISEAFRRVCSANGQRLELVAQRA
jgi:hypothetical protein